MSTIRCFVAVDPDADTIERLGLAMNVLRTRAPKAKWVHQEKLHVTLAFLGNVAPAIVPDIEQAMRIVASEHSPLRLRFEGGGTFGEKNLARVLWAKVDGDLPALCRLQSMLAEQLTTLGYVPEHRTYSPHLTLARAASSHGDASLLECAKQLEGQSFGESMIRELVLYRSESTPTGNRYVATSRQPLTKMTAEEAESG